MAATQWKPSKRAQEALQAAWRAFENGDRWLRCANPSTARYTVVSLEWNGRVEVDPADSHRFRLSEDWLNLNGLTRRVPLFAGMTLGAVYAMQEAIEVA